jgi:two-component system sensor histidine kinase KdpD
VALVNAVLSFKIRKEEEKSRDKEEKENAIKMYNTLLNSLSHELKTPIATIIGAVDVLKENKKQLSENSKFELLNEIDKASLRLNSQVENLLNMSRLESGMFKLKEDWVDTNELIFSVIQKFENTHHHSVVFHADENLPLFKYDRILIGQVLYNIINNAFIYTPEFSKIEISASQEEDLLCIIIKDDGPGFPEKEIPFVFDKFYRLPHSKSGGSGLGLSIAKGYIEAHNGTVELKNKEVGGAVFTIKIPAEISYINLINNE